MYAEDHVHRLASSSSFIYNRLAIVTHLVRCPDAFRDTNKQDSTYSLSRFDNQ